MGVVELVESSLSRLCAGKALGVYADRSSTTPKERDGNRTYNAVSMIALLCRRTRFTLGSSCCFRRGRCSAAVHFSHSSMAAPSSFFALARAMQSSHGTLAAGRRPRGRTVFELLGVDSLIAWNSRRREERMGNVKTVCPKCWTDGCCGSIRPSFRPTGPSIYSPIMICLPPTRASRPFVARRYNEGTR